MATLNIDNKQYNLGTLSDECKAQLASIHVEQALARLQAKAAVLQTAKKHVCSSTQSSASLFRRKWHDHTYLIKMFIRISVYFLVKS